MFKPENGLQYVALLQENMFHVYCPVKSENSEITVKHLILIKIQWYNRYYEAVISGTVLSEKWY